MMHDPKSKDDVRHLLFCDLLWQLRAGVMKRDALDKVSDDPTAVRAIVNSSSVTTKEHGRDVIGAQIEGVERAIFTEMNAQSDPYAYLFRPSYDTRMIYHNGRALGYSGQQINPATGVNEITLDIAEKFAKKKINDTFAAWH